MGTAAAPRDRTPETIRHVKGQEIAPFKFQIPFIATFVDQYRKPVLLFPVRHAVDIAALNRTVRHPVPLRIYLHEILWMEIRYHRDETESDPSRSPALPAARSHDPDDPRTLGLAASYPSRPDCFADTGTGRLPHYYTAYQCCTQKVFANDAALLYDLLKEWV